MRKFSGLAAGQLVFAIILKQGQGSEKGLTGRFSVLFSEKCNLSLMQKTGTENLQLWHN